MERKALFSAMRFDRLRGLLGGWTGLPALAGILAVLAGLQVWGREVRSGAFLIGDCPYYASATVSLVADGDLDLANQLRGGLEVHHKQVAMGRDGAWYPKHPVLLSVAAVPFYLLLGVPGFLVFNLLVFFLLAWVAWRLCRRHVPEGTATLATALVIGGSFLHAYVYNHSPDLFSALLVLAGLDLVIARRSAAAGGMLGLAACAKLTNLFVAALVTVLVTLRRPRRDAAILAAGILPGVLALALLNLALFGSPLESGYDRTIVLEGGVPVLVSHRGFFDLPLGEGIRGQLLDPRAGLLTTSPVLLLAVPGFFRMLRRAPWEALLVLSVSEFLFLLFSTYRWWATSHAGNRFLMVPVCLAAIPIAFLLDGLRGALVGTPARPLPAPGAETR